MTRLRADALPPLHAVPLEASPLARLVPPAQERHGGRTDLLEQPGIVP